MSKSLADVSEREQNVSRSENKKGEAKIFSIFDSGFLLCYKLLIQE
jgi:hypothetical protein